MSGSSMRGAELARLDLDEVVAEIGIAAALPAWSQTWARSARSCDPAAMWFLDPDALRATCAWLRMGEDAADALVAAAAAVRGRPALVRLLWHLHDALLAGEGRGAAYPVLPDALDDAGRLFYALLVVSGTRRARALHERRGVPEAVTVDTLDDLELWMRHERATGGRWAFKQAGWLMHHLDDRLWRIGRLQFEIRSMALPFHVYRAADGAVVALAGDGTRFRDDGQFADADGRVADDAWTATLRIDGAAVTGHPVGADGAVRREPVTLRGATAVLRPEDPVLSVHIQASGPMTEESCRASLRAALDFFPRHVREHSFVGCTCGSWLMDPQLALRLGQESNIVRFQRLFHPLPAPTATDEQTFERVFGGRIDPAAAPRDTTLRRAVLAHVDAGGRWRSAAGFILRDEMAL